MTMIQRSNNEQMLRFFSSMTLGSWLNETATHSLPYVSLWIQAAAAMSNMGLFEAEMCSSPVVPFQYLVYLADTRNFVSHLHNALERNKIRVFVDHSLERGLEIAPTINEAIEQSRSAIVVISQTFASSPWCLDELDKILECKEKKGQLVFLIFMDVDPKEMREQSGPFKRIGQNEKGIAQENADKVQRWRKALRKAGNLTGWSLENRY
ncbi:disease resistance protein RUN1 [Eucalyptus grandis]|uniref:disease resistance protein RUN1 n=1 Tax=Eucalyptus grandis TaxID=71139 RepID=UPI00192EFB94|nr:disease resistance protein RUN1 [Eucalyptus grandis]